MTTYIANYCEQHSAMVAALQKESGEKLPPMAEQVAQLLLSGGRLLIAGNGGSAAQAQHLAAELVGRFQHERRPLPACALTTDTSLLTAVANDYGYEQVFARQVSAHAGSLDALLLLSTSGNSPNLLQAATAAAEKGLFTLAWTGESGGELASQVDMWLPVPARVTSLIQEGHQMLLHMFCTLLEEALGLQPFA